MRYLLAFLLMVGVCFGIWYGAGAGEPPADFTFINRGTISTLDPAAMSWMQDIRMALTIWEGLCTYHPQTTEPIPGSALPPEISEDRTVYTFSIRPEARWSNGEPLTAHDFVYGWRRAFEPGTAADYSFFFDRIVGVTEYTDWRNGEIERLGSIKDPDEQRRQRDAHLAEADRRFAESVGIRALDDKTLEVRLTRPVPYFLDLCAFSTFLPVHRESVERFKVLGETGLIYYDEQWVKPGNAVHNGPFVMTEWKFKQHIMLERNPHYWNRNAVKLERMKELEVEDANTAWLLYSGGQADWLSYVKTVYAPKLIASSASPLPNALNKRGTGREDIHVVPAFGTYFYNFNCTERLPGGRPNPFLDPRVRQAFTMAIDKKTLIEEVVREGQTVATTFIPPNTIPGYPVIEGLPYDPPKARALLAEAGYPNGDGLPEIVVLFNTGFRHGDYAQAIVAMWERELGVDGRVEGMEGKTFLELKHDVNFVICRAGWYGDYGDPTTFLEMFETGNGNNDSGYSDPEYDRMLAEADAELDPQRRLEKLADVERYLVNEGLPLLPIYHDVTVCAFDPDKVKNLYLTPRMMTMLHVVEVVE